MAGLLQRLIELGEERPAAGRLSTSSGVNGNATREELTAELSQLRAQWVEQKSRYDELFADAAALRSEYDAFRRTAEREKRLMAQQRADDKRMLEELRRAGASGKMNEVYAAQTEAKLADLQARLQKAVEGEKKAYKRQLEAEQARLAAEASKKEDVQGLCQNFERFKEVMRQRNEELERQLLEARAAGEAPPEKKGVPAPNSTAVADSHGDDDTAAATSESPPQVQAFLASALQREKQMRAELVAEQERTQRRLEGAAWEHMEAERKIAELKMEVDTWRSKAAQLANTIEAQAEEHGLREKDYQLVIRQNEDNAARLERELQEAKQLAESRRQEWEQALAREREIEARHTAVSGDAECLKKTASEALEEQRVRFEELLREREGLLQEQQAACRALEATLQQVREDKRKQAERLEDLRQELEQAQLLSSEMELMQVQSQRLIVLREEELMSKEAERQKLRRRLREEEEAHERARERIRELELHYGEAELLRFRQAPVAEETAEGAAALERACSSAEARAAAQEAELQRRDQTIRQLQVQLDELIAQNAKFAFYREEQAAKTRRFEARIHELEAERSAVRLQHLQAENASDAERPHTSRPATAEGTFGAAATPSFEALYAAPSERSRQQFVSQAVLSAKKLRFSASSRLRRLIVVSLACTVFVLLATTYFAAPSNTQAVEGTEAAMEALRGRYTAASAALRQCQALLSERRGK
ncbi:uncharacterized protein Tco025E_00491 [Trypanosoma conorhini]|uniref:Transmembrane protein n=1 Tax=Trypanosoma conorhini TaxID=83891 RepID=A0A3R7PYV1_9TRYP|nr:uncharacterized protein Tco025E_00491 [Trypanosoma conorhini]RNF27299.1 hypothetical protein Tco025E_00491 [Trypanosoma conorhini]